MKSIRPLVIWAMVAVVNAVVVFAISAATEPSGVYYLDFTGGTVELPRFYPIPTEATLRIPPMRIDIRKLVLEAVRLDFVKWPGVQIKEGEAHELDGSNVVLVGGRAPCLLGIASLVDVGDRSSGGMPRLSSRRVPSRTWLADSGSCRRTRRRGPSRASRATRLVTS